MCGKLVDYYGDCNKVSFNKDGIPNANAPTYNLCSYRIGFTVVIVIPIIYTAGEISISLINKFKYVKLLNAINLSVSEDAVRMLNRAKQAGHEITYQSGKIIIKNGDEITTITQKAGQVEITTTGRIVNQVFTKIALGSDDLSKFAIEFRKTLPKSNHRGNIAVFEYIDNNGHLVKKAFTTKGGGGPHAEQLAKEWFETNNISKKNVKRIYSELEPCSLENSMCKDMLQKDFPNAQKSFSYDYPGGNNASPEIRKIRNESVNQREKDLKSLLKQ